jgi:hypothetical protein
MSPAWYGPIVSGALLAFTVVLFVFGSRQKLISSGGMGRPTMIQGLPEAKFSTMGFRWMWNEVNKLHSEYTSLQGAYPEQSRKPLDKAYWPWHTDKEVWNYWQLQMFRLEYSFRVFQELTQREWASLGWPDPPAILSIPDSAIMTEVLIALENHKELLTREISKVRQTKNAM